MQKLQEDWTQYDLAKAFYKVNVGILDPNGAKFPLTLKVDHQQYTSERMVFGLSCGPTGLNATQEIINWVIDKQLRHMRYARIVVLGSTFICSPPKHHTFVPSAIHGTSGPMLPSKPSNKNISLQKSDRF